MTVILGVWVIRDEDSFEHSKFTVAEGTNISIRIEVQQKEKTLHSEQLQLLSHFVCNSTITRLLASSSVIANIYCWILHRQESEKVSRRGVWPRNLEKFSDFFGEVTQQRCKENWAFHCLSRTHTHSQFCTYTTKHTPIIKGERSSPPSLFASSKSP